MDAAIEKASVDEREEHLPGEEGIWVFVMGDMIVFTFFFSIFLFYRVGDLEVFQSSRPQLSLNFGVVNTVLLLLGSWFVATSVTAFRRRVLGVAKHCMGLGALCGLAFCFLKYFEYSQKFAEGITPATNDFFMFYFVFTGIHLMHVIVGVGLLVYFWASLNKPAGLDKVSQMGVESGATYWHMVDLLWIVLFPLLYLLP